MSNLSEKKILGSPCFTIDCKSNGVKNIITKIEIFDNNAKVTSVIENSIPEVQPISSSPFNGAIRKYPLKTYSNLRRPHCPEHLSPQQIHSKEQSAEEVTEKETKLAKLVKLRKINFDTHYGKDLGLDKDKHDNGYLNLTTNILPDLSSTNNDTETIKQSHFLFEIIYEFVKSNSVVHIDKILSKWHETKEFIEDATDMHNYLDSDIIEFLLKSSQLLNIGNYICIPETLQQTLQLFEHQIIQQCKLVLQIDTHKEDSQPTVNEIISNKEIITSFENQTNQNSERLQYSTSNNDNDIKNNNPNFTEVIIFDKMQSNIKENMTKNIIENNFIKQLSTVDELSSELKILQEKYTRLTTNYSIVEQNVTKLIKEKADMEQNFKLQLENKTSIMEALINERKMLIKKLETYETHIARDISIKNEALNKSELAFKSEITKLKQQNLNSENSIRLLLEEKNSIKMTLKEKNTQLLESIQHYQAEINKKNTELITLQDKNLELKKSMLEKSLESQFFNNQSSLVTGIKHCQVAVEIFTNLNYVFSRHVGFEIISNVNIWLEAYNHFQILFDDLKKEYWKLKSLLDSNVKVAIMDKIVMKSFNLPPYPTKTLDTIICDAFMVLYRHMIQVTQQSSLKFQPTPLLLNCVVQQPIPPNKFNLKQCFKEDTPTNSDNSNEDLKQKIHKIGRELTEDKDKNISQKLDLDIEHKRDAEHNNKDTNNKKEVECNLKDNINDFESKTKEYIRVNNPIIVEATTNENCSTDITNNHVSKTPYATKSISKPSDKHNNIDCELVLESKINKTTRAENIENTEQEGNRIVTNSTDKLMNILRNQYTGISELSLLTSLNDARKKHGGSLTGIPLNIILQYVNKYILLSQIDYLCIDSETKKTVNNTATAVKERKKQSNSKVKGKSSKGTVKIKPLENLSFRNLTKSRLESQKTQYKPVPSTSSEPGSSTKNPWSIIVKPGTNKKHYEESECVICMENLEMVNKVTYTLDCQHKFHKTCIKDWFQQNQSCPTCRIHCTIDEEYPPLP